MGTGYDDTSFDMALGKAVKAERHRRGWNQYDVAKHLGFPRWCMWEVETRGVFRTTERLRAARRFVAEGQTVPPTARVRSTWVEEDEPTAAERNPVFLRNADLCVQVARAMFGDATEAVIESQAVALMSVLFGGRR